MREGGHTFHTQPEDSGRYRSTVVHGAHKSSVVLVSQVSHLHDGIPRERESLPRVHQLELRQVGDVCAIRVLLASQRPGHTGGREAVRFTPDLVVKSSLVSLKYYLQRELWLILSYLRAIYRTSGK